MWYSENKKSDQNLIHARSPRLRAGGESTKAQSETSSLVIVHAFIAPFFLLQQGVETEEILVFLGLFAAFGGP